MNWCFTWNNPSMYTEEARWDEVPPPPNVWPDVSYVIWQYEQGESGTPHYQGYVQLKKQYRLSTLASNMPEGIHWEPRKGSHAQAKAYCQKEDSRLAGPWEHGTETHQGRDSALVPMLAAVKEGKPELDIVDMDPLIWARYFRAIERYRKLVTPARKDGDTVFTTIYWGETDIGKSWRAQFEAVSQTGRYYKLPTPQNQKQVVWWDDYAGEEDVIIDEFNGQISQTYMNTICDRYKCQVQTKGGIVRLNMRRLWITSNNNPAEWWPNVGIRPFLKRVTGDNGNCEHMTVPWRPEQDGELLIADYEDAAERIAKKNAEIDALEGLLQEQLPDEHPQKKRRLQQPIPMAVAMGMLQQQQSAPPWNQQEEEEIIRRRMGYSGRYSKLAQLAGSRR